MNGGSTRRLNVTDADFKLCPFCDRVAVTTTVNLFDSSLAMNRCLKCKAEWDDARETEDQSEEA